MALFSSCEVARAAFSCEYYNPWNGTSMKTDQDFVKCQFFSRFFVWQCSPSVCKSRSPRSLGSSSGDRAPFVFLPQEIRRTSCHLSNTRPYTPAFPLLPFFGAQKCQKWLRFKPATHPPTTSQTLKPQEFFQAQVQCQGFSYAVAAAHFTPQKLLLVFLRRIQNFRNLYSVG